MDDAICGGGGDGTVDAFRPEDIDVDEPPPPPEPPPPVIDVTVRRAYVATSEEAPGPWPLPPSQTRKRPRGKGRHAVVAASALEQLKQDEAGRWACGACGSVYPDPTGLYGHLRFRSPADAVSVNSDSSLLELCGQVLLFCRRVVLRVVPLQRARDAPQGQWPRRTEDALLRLRPALPLGPQQRAAAQRGGRVRVRRVLARLLVDGGARRPPPLLRRRRVALDADSCPVLRPAPQPHTRIRTAL